MTNRKTSVFISVFGQIGSVVAEAMIAEGEAKRIDFAHIPLEVRYNAAGQPAYCALFLSVKAEQEFDRRVAALTA